MVLVTTVYNRLVGSYGLVDDSVDLSFVTTPLLAIILVYTIVTIFVFIAYLVLIKKVKKEQIVSCNTYAMLTASAKSQSDKGRVLETDLCSIIIPSKNEESVIRRTVEECLKQSHQNLEVIVVCHNCTDRTFEEANVKDSRVRVYDFKTKEVGKGIALNHGVQKGKRELLINP